ncbi:TPA: efflux RND transporter permease subunit [Candidatus Micrarchaeota archaeon]|nr:efflux RND transporter permease subunit [Candidatus Micrarchaeota archaeon]
MRILFWTLWKPHSTVLPYCPPLGFHAASPVFREEKERLSPSGLSATPHALGERDRDPGIPGDPAGEHGRDPGPLPLRRELRIADLRGEFLTELLDTHPRVSARWEGQQKETRESFDSLMVGFLLALCGMFALLTLEFRSYVQPLIILAVIPFGFVGAVLAHLAAGLLQR